MGHRQSKKRTPKESHKIQMNQDNYIDILHTLKAIFLSSNTIIATCDVSLSFHLSHKLSPTPTRKPLWPHKPLNKKRKQLSTPTCIHLLYMHPNPNHSFDKFGWWNDFNCWFQLEKIRSLRLFFYLFFWVVFYLQWWSWFEQLGLRQMYVICMGIVWMSMD